MRRTLTLLVFFLMAAPVSAQNWSKYVAKNLRRDLVKECTKKSGSGAALSGQGALAIWVTEPVARVLVSQAIDNERISNQEADARYEELRPKDRHLFLIDARSFTEGALSPISGVPLPDPLAKKEVFLQRANDTKQFSKGEVREQNFEVNLSGLYRGFSRSSAYFVTFPKVTRDDQPLINSLEDKLEIQFAVSGKKIVLDYRLKNLSHRLEDL